MKLIFDGRTSLSEYRRLIKEATKSIHLSVYIVKPDEVMRELFDLLDKRHKEGIDVKLIYDFYGCWRCLFFLRKYKWATPYSRTLNRRLHAKISIFDGKIGIVSGRNFAKEYFQRWHDTSIVLTKPNEIKELQFFWDHILIGFPLVNMLLKFTSEKQHEIYDIVVTNIRKAKNEILIISPYFVIDKTLMVEMRKACERGVNVTVITPLKMENGLMEIFNRLNFHKVEHTNFRTYHTTNMFHSKIILIDDVGIVGSANFDLRSFKINFEACVQVDKKHITQIKKHSQVLKEHNAKYSRFKRRVDSVLEFLFRPIMPLL